MSFLQMLKRSDRLNHELLQKLKLDLIDFFKNRVNFWGTYLSKTGYSVGKEYSEKYYTSSGIQQGSNITTLLFLIFINYLPSALSLWGRYCALILLHLCVKKCFAHSITNSSNVSQCPHFLKLMIENIHIKSSKSLFVPTRNRFLPRQACLTTFCEY